MQENKEKTNWTYCKYPYSSETTVFDTYLEEHKSRSSTPKQTIQQSSTNLLAEIHSTMETLQIVNKEITLANEIQKYQTRKSLLKSIRQNETSNRNTILHAIAHIFSKNDDTTLKNAMIREIEQSTNSRFILIVSGLGHNILPLALYSVGDSMGTKILGPSDYPVVITDEFLRFILKYDYSSNKFKILKRKSLSGDIDAVILR